MPFWEITDCDGNSHSVDLSKTSIKTIDDVKADMERSQPMDRLICGDVGYGKTEVAMRAAFKSAAAGKQVAVLVPTTVLCLQHFTTFQKRFQDFPINIEMLSRLRTDKQSKTIKSNLEKGSIDIIVGTHSLLAKSINFHDKSFNCQVIYD